MNPKHKKCEENYTTAHCYGSLLCQFDCTMGYPDIYIILGVSMRVFLNAINI